MAAHKRKALSTEAFLTDGVLFWIASGILAYSCLVLLLALDSLALAETALRFQRLNACAIIGLVLLGPVSLFFKVLESGWTREYLVPLFAFVLLLPGAQPAEGCCSALVGYIAGRPPGPKPEWTDVLCHLAPMLGCALLIAADIGNRRRSWRSK